MVLLPLRCLFWGSLLTAVHPERIVCREKQYLINSQCCNLCPPGEKLVNDCTEITDTECIRCKEGEFLGTWNTERHCHQHKYCDPNLGLRVQREGTSETDTICTCDKGLHCTNDACESCTLHSLCLPGLGVRQIATGVSDTVCDPCPVGFFSNVSSALEKCHPWTSCETKGLMEIEAGTNKTDAVCGSPPRIRALVVIPITMGILLAVLLVSACISECPGKVAKEPENKVMCQDPVEDPVEDLEDFPVPPPSIAPVQETLHGCQPVTQEDGKESRISVQEKV
ncbi:tumor necrosis factor receptor superfamily member 5 isoform X1 [Ursus americanus]|uniref:Tumor necrosis factor receptor superfamily member 5 n=1 Tax=Ursus maritimus TaxID=29073 RepID=A0A384CP88_URSMA|nr:tumor necrosis factor receptor superfamily member 5 isoform X1 [Ursus maritimus]XP_026359427.1 tumor necrosis factor receptor superfamily member 5 isoform X2 [Ursus arctos]XP_045660728.1 tumor necrosis factor receptor superfamily member 5 isoform X1 [Ursus americanus]